MFNFSHSSSFFRRGISFIILINFIFSSIYPARVTFAQTVPASNIFLLNPLPLHQSFTPTIVRGLTLYPDKPLQFDFIVDTGNESLDDKTFKEETKKLIKYFLASLTTPEEDMWVNLSPYEKNRVIPDNFGKTQMGMDLLVQDYLLKQLTASLLSPDNETGKIFWDHVYQKTKELYGSMELPVNTLSKVWIIPDKATVYEHNNSAFVVERHLKVLTEEDYFAAQQRSASRSLNPDSNSEDRKLQSEIIKEIIIPEIEREVNEGKSFANLRQIYNSMILAAWYKKNLRESLLGKVYVDQSKTNGVNTNDLQMREKVYDEYLKIFRQGVYDSVKEEYDPQTQSVVAKQYFSGGARGVDAATLGTRTGDIEKQPEAIREAAVKPAGEDRTVTWRAENTTDASSDQAQLADALSWDSTGHKRIVKISDKINFEIGRFPDGEVHLRNLNPDETKNADITLTHFAYSEADIVQAIMIMDNLRHYGAKSINLVLPDWKTLLNGDEYLLSILSMFADKISVQEGKRDAKGFLTGYEEPKEIKRITKLPKVEKKNLPIKIDQIYYLDPRFRDSASEIASKLSKEVRAEEITVGHDDNGSYQVAFKQGEDPKGKNVFLYHTTRTSRDIVNLMLVLASLREHGVGSITLFNTYQGYARQDKISVEPDNLGEHLSAASLLKMVDKLVDQNFAVNVHYGDNDGIVKLPGAEDLQVYNLNGAVPLAEYMAHSIIEKALGVKIAGLDLPLSETRRLGEKVKAIFEKNPIMIVSPDFGGQSYARNAAQELQRLLSIAFGVDIKVYAGFIPKWRNKVTGETYRPGTPRILEITDETIDLDLSASSLDQVEEIVQTLGSLEFDNGKSMKDAWAFILDDITATGGTLLSANSILRDEIGIDQSRIYNGVVHGAFSNGLDPFKPEALQAAEGKAAPAKLFAMETLPLPEETAFFQRVPIGSLARYAIERIIGKDLDKHTKSGRPKKVAIIGGTFNPFTIAHKKMGEQLLDAPDLGIDEVIYVPNNVSPLRQGEPDLEPAEKRYQWVKDSIKGDDRMSVSDFDITREGPSYTADLVKHIKNLYPEGSKIYFVVGEDKTPEIETKWARLDEIKETVERFIVFSRPGYQPKSTTLRTINFTAPTIDVSATEIRNRVATGRSVRGFVDESIRNEVENAESYSPDNVFSEFYRGRPIKSFHGRDLPFDQPFAVIFDTHGNLLQSTWKEEYALAFHTLTGRSQEEGMKWVEEHIMKDIVDTTKDVPHAEIVRRLKATAVDMINKEVTEEDVERAINDARLEYKKPENAKARPGAIEAVKEIAAMGIPFQFISGSTTDVIKGQLAAAGFGKFITDENLIGIDKQKELEDKTSVYNRREQAILRFHQENPGHTIIQFDDWRTSIGIVHKLNGIAIATPQGEGLEYHRNFNKLVYQSNADLVITKESDWKKMTDIIRILNKRRLDAQKKIVQKKLRVALAQINPKVGDLVGNFNLVLDAIKKAQELGVDQLNFPELTMVGYPAKDLLRRKSFVVQNKALLKALIPHTKGITITVGFVDIDDQGFIYNAVAEISNGELKGIYRKNALPNYGRFREKRYFKPGKGAQLVDFNGNPLVEKVFNINKIKKCDMICEDGWVNQDEKAGLPRLEDTDILPEPDDSDKPEVYLEQAGLGANVISNSSASPFREGVMQTRLELFKKRAIQTGSWIFYTNHAGAQDEDVFDGGSFIINPKGEIVAQAERFKEDFLVADIEVDAYDDEGEQSKTIPLYYSDAPKPPLPERKAPKEYDRLDEVEESLVVGMRDYFHKQGMTKAILGMSGGLDSAYTAYIAARALGKENVIGISMPTKFNSDGSKSDARIQSEKLGIQFLEIPIKSVHEAFRNLASEIFVNNEQGASILAANPLVDENMQPRLRMTLLYLISNAIPRSLVLATGNKSELAVGFFTAYGDGAGGWSSIGSVYKTDVYRLSERVNEKAKEEVILNSIIKAEPSAGLSDKGKDTDRLPPYPVLDPLLRQLVDEEGSLVKLIEAGAANSHLMPDIERMIRIAQWKRVQIPRGVITNVRPFSVTTRDMPIVNGYDELAVQLFLDQQIPDHAQLSELTEQEKAALTPVFGSAKEFFDQITAWEAQHPESKIVAFGRHGESASNLFGLVQTYISFSPPTTRGEKQAEAFAQFLRERNIGFDRYISSDLERAFQIAALTARDFGKTPEIFKRFREALIHPVAGGIELARLRDHFPDLFKAFLQDPLKYRIPGQYSGVKFKRYARQIFDEIAGSNNKRTLITSHGLTIILSMMELLGIDFEKYYPVYDFLGKQGTANLSLTVFAYNSKTQNWRLLVKPDNTYLPEDLQGRTTDEEEKKREYRKFLDTAVERLIQQKDGKISLLSDYFPTDVTFFQPDDEALRRMIDPFRSLINSLAGKEAAMLATDVDNLNKELPPGYPKRDAFNPPTYTADKVKQSVRSRENPEGWADPDLDDPNLSRADQNRTKEEIRAFIQSYAPQTKFVNGRPRNKQEMFMNGRGDLGWYGPNLAEDALIFRLNQDGKIEVLAGKRDDYPDGLALAGQFAKREEVTPDKIGVTASKAANREFNAKINFQRDGVVVYEGPSGDWRDTNDAWVITRGIAVFLTYEESQRLNIQAKKGMAPDSVKWVSVTEKNKFYARHQMMIDRALSKIALKQLKTSEEKKVNRFDELTISVDQLNEAYDAFRAGKENYKEVYDVVIPQTPHGSNYYVAAGLEESLADIRRRRFTPDHIVQLRKLGRYNEKFLKFLSEFIFEGDVSGLREGSVVTSDVPLLRVKASPVEIKLLEGLIKNRLAFNTNIATKTSRIKQAANGAFISKEDRERLIREEGYDPVRDRDVIDYGQRRAQWRAALAASRSAIIGGATATSNVKAAKQYFLEPSGTMAHAFVMMFPPELEIEAFRIYAEAYPDTSVFLIDTYDTIEGAKKAIKVALEMRQKGHELVGVRLDSGDLIKLSKEVRKLLDDAGLTNVKIFASDDLHEDRITELLSQGARIDGFGVGTNLVTGGKQASLEMKIQKSDEKRFWRVHQDRGQVQKFITTSKGHVAYAAYQEDIEEMLILIWQDGNRVNDAEKPWQAHLRAEADMKRLKPGQKRLADADSIPVEEQDNPLSINPEEDAVVDIDGTVAFFIGGGLPVGNAEQIVKPGRNVLNLFPKKNRFAAIDKHPWGHISLATSYIDLPPMTTVLTPEVIAGWTEKNNPIAEHALFNLSDLHVYLEGGFKKANYKEFVDDIDGLLAELKAQGYVNQYGVKTEIFKNIKLEDFKLSEKFAKQRERIFQTLQNHRGVGFQVLWTEHAREDSGEDELFRGFLNKEFEYIVTKGMDADDDSYSAYKSNAGVPTELDGQIKKRGFKRLFFWGLAEDYCVGASACNAADLGYEVYVVIDATKPVGVPEGSIENMRKEFEKRGIKVITSQELIDANQNLGVKIASRHETPITHPTIFDEEESTALEEDFYHLTMGQAMFNRGFHRRPATFDYFYRSTPFDEPYVIVSGVKLFLEDLMNFKFSDEQIEYLRRTGKFTEQYLEFLSTYRFRGNITGLPEGSVAFPRESIASIDGTMFDIIIETLLLKDGNFPTLEASWANHEVLNGNGNQLIDDGLSTAQGKAHLAASWAAFIGGLSRTTNLDAYLRYGIPLAIKNDEGERLRGNILTGGEKASHGGVLKLAEIDGDLRAKVSGANPAKASLPGKRRSYEIVDADGKVVDLINGLEDDILNLPEGMEARVRQIPWVSEGEVVYTVGDERNDAFEVQAFVRDQVERYAEITEARVSDHLAAAQKELIARAQAVKEDEERVQQMNRKSPKGYPTRDLNNPPTFTAGHVSDNSISLKNGDTKLTETKWAHPWIEEPGITPEERHRRVDFVQADIKRWAPDVKFGPDGLPLLPYKTGMKGRGFNGRYGPNPTEDFIILRRTQDGKGLEVLTGLRRDGGGRTLPGGHVNHGEENEKGKTAQREALEELSVDLPLDESKIVLELKGEDLWGITDNAWKLQRGVAVLISYEDSLKLNPKAGDDLVPNSQQWISAANPGDLFSNHSQLLQAGVEAVQRGELRAKDEAQTAEIEPRRKGGIDFNSSNLDLNIKRDEKSMPMSIPVMPIENLKINGLTPLIINVAPANVPLLLGLGTSDHNDQNQRAQNSDAANLSLLYP